MITLFSLILAIVLILMAIPTGLLVSHLARDELIQGRKWFLRITIISIVCAAILLGFSINYTGFALLFISLFALVSYLKSFDKNWAKLRKN